MQGGDEGHHRIIGQRIAERDSADGSQIFDDPIGERTDLPVIFLRLLDADRLAIDGDATDRGGRNGIVIIIAGAIIGITAIGLNDRFVFGPDETAFDLQLTVGGQRDEGATACDLVAVEDIGPIIQGV